MLEVHELTKEYKNGDNILTAVNKATFKVNTGEVVIIMGPSGSGKSTLVSMLGGLSRPTFGTAALFEREITSLNQTELARFRLQNIGFVFQNYKLLHSLSPEENVMVPLCCLGKHSHKKALMSAREMLKSLGLESRFGFAMDKLSGGEKQRVAIARALINNPKLILADEPTASLDSETGKTVAHLLREVAKKENRIVIIVSHDPRISPIADRIFKVEDGCVKEMDKQ